MATEGERSGGTDDYPRTAAVAARLVVVAQSPSTNAQLRGKMADAARASSAAARISPFIAAAAALVDSA